MKQRHPLAQCNIKSKFRCHHAAYKCHLSCVPEIVLSITRPVFKPAEQFDNLRMYILYPEFKQYLLSILLHVLFYILPYLIHEVLDASRMDPAVRDKFFKGLPGYLTADGVKAGNNYCLRCIINYKIHSCSTLKRPNVSSFPSDNPPLHLVIRQRRTKHSGA